MKGLPVEQFACFGDYDRDPRARVITAAYMSLVDEGSVRGMCRRRRCRCGLV